MKQRVAQGDSSTVGSIPSKRRGRPLTLRDLDPQVQEYIRALHEAGAPVETSVIIAAAKGIIMSVNQTNAGRKWKAYSTDQDMGTVVNASHGAGEEKSEHKKIKHDE